MLVGYFVRSERLVERGNATFLSATVTDPDSTSLTRMGTRGPVHAAYVAGGARMGWPRDLHPPRRELSITSGGGRRRLGMARDSSPNVQGRGR